MRFTRTVFMIVWLLTGVAELAVGSTVVAWGNNGAGNLNVPGVSNIVAISAGRWLSMALLSDGTVTGWSIYYTPGPPGLSNVVAIAGGDKHSLALKRDGTVVAWGNNSRGQTNVPPGLTNVVGIAAGNESSLALKRNGTVSAWGLTVAPPSDLSNVVAIAGGDRHWVALKADSTVATWGNNNNGQLPIPPPGLSNVVAVAAGLAHSIAFLENGTVVTWGQTGPVPDGLSNVVAVAAGGWWDSHTATLKQDGTVVTWGIGGGPVDAPEGLSNVVAISCGNLFDLALVVEESPLVVVRQPLDHAVFSGMPVTFGVGVVSPQPVNYQWQFAGTNISGETNASLVLTNVQVADAGFYRVVVHNSDKSIISSNAQLVVTTSGPTIIAQTPNLLVNLTSNTTITVTVIGSWPFNYQWRFNGSPIPGATDSALNLINLQNQHSGFYDVVVSNSYGATTNTGTYLTVNDLPSAVNAVELVWTTSGDALWFCETNHSHDGRAAAQSGVISASYKESKLETTVVGPGTLSFWCELNSGWGTDFLVFFIDDVDQFYIPIQTFGWQHKVFYIPDGAHTLLWNYTTPFNTDGRDAAWVDEVTYVPGPTSPGVSIFPVSQTVSAGTNVTMSVGAFGTPPLHYQWQFNGVSISGATNTSLSLTNVQAAHDGTYSIIVSNNYGVTNQFASLTISPVAPTLISQPSSQRLLINSSATLAVAARGSEPFTYQWRFNGTDISGATNATLVLASLQVNDTGNYQAVVSNPYGTVTSTNAFLVVSRTLVVAWGAGTNITFSPHLGQSKVPLTLTNPIAVAGGLHHSVALDTDGRVTAWGNNANGQISVPNGLSNLIAIAAGHYHTLALDSGRTVTAWGAGTNVAASPNLGQSKVPVGLTNVTAVAAGGFHSVALKADGRVSVWGWNAFGQTNVPASVTNVVQVAAGGYHSLALKRDGTVAAWGAGTNISGTPHFGQSKVPAGLSNVVFVAAGFHHSLALRNDGTVIGWGVNQYGQTNIPAGLTNVIAIASGGYHNMAISRDGEVTLWGAGTNASFSPHFGQSRVPADLTNTIAIAAGVFHSLAIVNDGTPFIIRQIGVQTVQAGGDVTFAIAAVGVPTLSYQWQLNGTNIQGATNALLVLLNVALTSGGNYRCVVTNPIGFADSRDFVLAVTRGVPRFEASAFQVTNGFRLVLTGLSGHGDVILYASTNLLDWDPILSNSPVVGTLQFVDPAATNLPVRFYRATEE